MTLYGARTSPRPDGSRALAEAYVFTQDIPPVDVWGTPGVMVRAEIDFPDGTKMIVPQPASWRTLSMIGVITALEKGSQKPAERRSRVPRVPVGGMVLIVLGLGLIGLGMVMSAWN